MTFDEFVALATSNERWAGVSRLPWGDAAFSERMLREHLAQTHDGASRRSELIDRHVAWMHGVVLEGRPARVLDLGCGPGFYTQRLAALGHRCIGIDIAPAAIAHARLQADAIAPQPRYLRADFTTLVLQEQFDLAMIIHGELNTLTRDEAASVLRRIRGSLEPGGRVLLEVHRFAAVEAIGHRRRTWVAAARGLFGDEPHLRIDESRWDAAAAEAISLNWIIREGSQAERFGTVTRAYSDAEYAELLAQAGFGRITTHQSLDGGAADTNYQVLLASV